MSRVVDPFFMDIEPGQRFCLFRPASPAAAYQGAILYLHPFAEELNKSRRLVALQARAFAAAGYDVLQIDLFGCGDSDGDLADARWRIWTRDAFAAQAWLAQQGPGPFYLWGLRLGALLALDLAAQAKPAAMLLWQPELDGKACIRNFLRLRLAAQMGTATDVPLRALLDQNGGIEVAGYWLSAALARDMEHRVARQFNPPRCPVHCFWISASGTADASRYPHSRLTTHGIQGPAFWMTNEINECPALIEASSRVLSK